MFAKLLQLMQDCRGNKVAPNIWQEQAYELALDNGYDEKQADELSDAVFEIASFFAPEMLDELDQ